MNLVVGLNECLLSDFVDRVFKYWMSASRASCGGGPGVVLAEEVPVAVLACEVVGLNECLLSDFVDGEFKY